jgi:electron transfer flavoprotein beta subunit
VLSTTRRPARSAGQLVKDDGEGGKALADFLAAQRFI